MANLWCVIELPKFVPYTNNVCQIFLSVSFLAKVKLQLLVVFLNLLYNQKLNNHNINIRQSRGFCVFMWYLE